MEKYHYLSMNVDSVQLFQVNELIYLLIDAERKLFGANDQQITIFRSLCTIFVQVLRLERQNVLIIGKGIIDAS